MVRLRTIRRIGHLFATQNFVSIIGVQKRNLRVGVCRRTSMQIRLTTFWKRLHGFIQYLTANNPRRDNIDIRNGHVTTTMPCCERQQDFTMRTKREKKMSYNNCKVSMDSMFGSLIASGKARQQAFQNGLCNHPFRFAVVFSGVSPHRRDVLVCIQPFLSHCVLRELILPLLYEFLIFSCFIGDFVVTSGF